MKNLVFVFVFFLASIGSSLSASNTHSLPRTMPDLTVRPSTKIYMGAGIVITLLSIGVLSKLYYHSVYPRSNQKTGMYDSVMSSWKKYIGDWQKYMASHITKIQASTINKTSTTKDSPQLKPVPFLLPITNNSIQEQVLALKNVPGCSVFDMDTSLADPSRAKPSEQIEVAFESQKMDRKTTVSPWKIHIAAKPSVAAKVLAVVSGVLCKKGRPLHFKFVSNENILDEYNNLRNKMIPELGLYKSGKFMTIYAKDNNEILELAQELNNTFHQAQKNGILDHNTIVSHTDRPIGTTGFIWARHDQAGAPISDVEFLDNAHATATSGNYRVAVYYPDAWLDLDASAMNRRIAEGKKELQTKDGASNGMKRQVFPDIFEKDWGRVEWDESKEIFVNKLS